MSKKPDKPLKTKQQKFCEARAAGFTLAESYLKAGYNPSTSELAGKNAFILARKPHVAAHLQRLRAGSFSKQAMSLAEKRAMLARIVREAPAELDDSSPLCQSYTKDVGADGSIHSKTTLPDKLRCIEIDNKMAGHTHADMKEDSLKKNPFLFLVTMGSGMGGGEVINQ